MKYVIPLEVKSCNGNQEFIVEADSIEEAIEKFKNGEGEFLSEEIEVMDFEEIDVSAIYIHEGIIEKSIQEQLTQSQERVKELEAYCVWFYNYANKHKESDERTSILKNLSKDFPYLNAPTKPSSEGEG